jgi:hypothetical protein
MPVSIRKLSISHSLLLPVYQDSFTNPTLLVLFAIDHTSEAYKPMTIGANGLKIFRVIILPITIHVVNIKLATMSSHESAYCALRVFFYSVIHNSGSPLSVIRFILSPGDLAPYSFTG